MPNGVEYVEDPGEGADGELLALFMAHSRLLARAKGVVALEFFECVGCNREFTRAHPFCESLPCTHCGHWNVSKSPRLPTPGEVTKEMLSEAMRAVRSVYPEINDATAAWMDRQEGHVRAIGAAMGCREARKALDQVERFARMLSAGHGGGDNER